MKPKEVTILKVKLVFGIKKLEKSLLKRWSRI